MPSGPPVLVSAAYQSGGGELTLTFDRAVDIAGFVPDEVFVDDGDVGFRYGAVSATSVGPAAVLVMLSGIEEITAEGITLDAGAGNGIVAADGGDAWAGVAGLPLPFPAPPGGAIVWVLPGAAAGTFVTHLTQPLLAYDDVEKMLGVSADGGETWALPVAIDLSDPFAVVFTFVAGDVGGATQWYVPGASNWHFANGQPMAPPFGGAIGREVRGQRSEVRGQWSVVGGRHCRLIGLC